ncbi:hypothetical protein QX204_05895 [Nocardia sp. PE-7]|uniref:hypothetical protein n=1 Tax=Nocardia sp. PE-7 TaxID=3058426 RepID=UPI00265843FE|nr:hypothetical protein [Nocardia sp. PE-7]WKG11008.1 hypothetical protein QX204_05895 [Nocardia sp. PE-7]
MTDPHLNVFGTAPVSLFSAQNLSDVSTEPAEKVPGNRLPTFLAAVEDPDPT